MTFLPHRCSAPHSWRSLLSITLGIALCCPIFARQAHPPAALPADASEVSAQSAQSKQVNESADSSAGIPATSITEDELKHSLLAKPLYLRACYLDNSLSFNEHGVITGNPTQGSYTLCGIEIEKIHLSKHKIELLGARYGLHFLGALASEDPATTVDRVRITPNKKFLRITIDREIVINKKKKHTNSPATPSTLITTPEVQKDNAEEPSPDLQLHASIAAAPEAEKPADPKTVTTTTSPAHAAQLLRDSLDKIFAPSLDARMKASMPDFWRLYYQSAADKTDYRPSNPAVLRQKAVDRKAHLISTFEPASNEFAQAAAVAGMALYHAVIGPDGKPSEIAVARPIGFGLDENAVAAIREARFEPALKNGQPVPVLLDLVVQFRIFSHRTGSKGESTTADNLAKPDAQTKRLTTILPGPYSRSQ